MEFQPDHYRLLLAVPLIPLVAYVLQIFFGRHLPRRGDWLPTGGMFVVMCITVYMFSTFIAAEGGFFHESAAEGGPVFAWLYQSADKLPGLNVVAGLLYDPLGAGMLAVVGIVSFFVHLFSVGYMSSDHRYHIFFANISLFTFAMLGLVLSDNLLFVFIFWELMGLMSYLLIGHFSQDPNSPRIKQAAPAAKKAFTWNEAKAFLREHDVVLISAGLDEVPMGYKDIEKVMSAQRDLVDIVARFDPKLVKMAPGDS